MSDHVFDLYIDQDWIGMKLRCTHTDPTDLKWYGDYDEMGELLHQVPGADCWAKEYADADGWFLSGELVNPTFPMPVHVWFDGSGLSAERVDL